MEDKLGVRSLEFGVIFQSGDMRAESGDEFGIRNAECVIRNGSENSGAVVIG